MTHNSTFCMQVLSKFFTKVLYRFRNSFPGYILGNRELPKSPFVNFNYRRYFIYELSIKLHNIARLFLIYMKAFYYNDFVERGYFAHPLNRLRTIDRFSLQNSMYVAVRISSQDKANEPLRHHILKGEGKYEIRLLR